MRKALLLALLLAGCGGSSSETQPPLEPDPSSYRYTGPRIPREGDEELMPTAPALDEDDLPAPKSSGRSTWGSGNPPPAPAPVAAPMTPGAAPATPSAAPAAPSAARTAPSAAPASPAAPTPAPPPSTP